MNVRSKLKQFHPNSEMECLSKNRSDIVVIKRGFSSKGVFTIHNMTENKINYQLKDKDLPNVINDVFNMHDYLTNDKYNWNNITLNPFQVLWLGIL